MSPMLARSCPVVSVQAPLLHRFRQVLGRDRSEGRDPQRELQVARQQRLARTLGILKMLNAFIASARNSSRPREKSQCSQAANRLELISTAVAQPAFDHRASAFW